MSLWSQSPSSGALIRTRKREERERAAKDSRNRLRAAHSFGALVRTPFTPAPNRYTEGWLGRNRLRAAHSFGLSLAHTRPERAFFVAIAFERRIRSDTFFCVVVNSTPSKVAIAFERRTRSDLFSS